MSNMDNEGSFSPDSMQPFTLLERFDQPWSPLAWAGRGAVALGEARWLEGLLFTGLALALCLGIFLLCLQTAEKLYYTGWANIQISAVKKKPVRANGRNAAAGRKDSPAWLDEILPRSVRGIIWKDIQLLRRDLRNLSTVVTALIFGLVYTVMLVRGGGDIPEGQGDAPELFLEGVQGLLSYGSVAISLFVASMLTGRLGGLGFSMEGGSYWIIKTAPISRIRLVAAKFLSAYLPGLALAWLYLAIVYVIHAPTGQVLVYGFAASALCLAGATALSLSFGIRNARLTWTDPRQMQSSATGCLAQLVNLLFFALAMGGFFVLPIGLALLNVPVFWAQVAGAWVGGAIVLVFGGVALWLARNYVSRIGEEA